MIILGIETSCDETSIALVKDGKEILAEKTYSQIEHVKYHGVVPEIASRVHVEVIFNLIKDCMGQAKIEFQQLDAVAVTKEPGLLGSLLIGFSVAKTIAYAKKKPLIGVNHLWAHLYAPFLENDAIPFPYAGLVVSGGHTLLCKVHSFEKIEVMGSTIDDAVGECYDKVAKMLDLPYPGGSIIDKLAETGNDNRYDLPLIALNYEEDRYNFSYSGLKTAVRRLIEKEGRDKINHNDLAASFQKKAIDMLVKKSHLLCVDNKMTHLVVGGGVSCNSYLRKELLNIKNLNTLFASPRLCSDNASMVAGLAFHLPQLSKEEYISLDVKDKFIKFTDKQELRKKESNSSL